MGELTFHYGNCDGQFFFSNTAAVGEERWCDGEGELLKREDHTSLELVWLKVQRDKGQECV